MTKICQKIFLSKIFRMKFNIKKIRRLNILIGGGLSGMYFYNNAYSLEDIKNKLELKINNTPASVPSKITDLIRDVMDDMALGSEERSLIKVFIVDDFSLKHLGYPDKKFGVFLGVPQHFVLDRTSTFDVVPMVGDDRLSSDSPEAWNFRYSISLSEEAKKFAVACELYEAKHMNFYYMGLLPPFVLLQGNAISFLSEKLFKAFGRTLPLIHALVFLLALGFYILLNDIINTFTQADAEYLAAALGTSYIEGGIEYYEKILARNKAVKKLDKNAPYTEKGEYKKYMGFRTHSMPFEKRIKYLKNLKRNYRLTEKTPEKSSL